MLPLISVRKLVSKQTDTHARNLLLFGSRVLMSQECLQKVLFYLIKREQRYYEFKLDVYRKQTGDK